MTPHSHLADASASAWALQKAPAPTQAASASAFASAKQLEGGDGGGWGGEQPALMQGGGGGGGGGWGEQPAPVQGGKPPAAAVAAAGRVSTAADWRCKRSSLQPGRQRSHLAVASASALASQKVLGPEQAASASALAEAQQSEGAGDGGSGPPQPVPVQGGGQLPPADAGRVWLQARRVQLNGAAEASATARCSPQDAVTEALEKASHQTAPWHEASALALASAQQSFRARRPAGREAGKEGEGCGSRRDLGVPLV